MDSEQNHGQVCMQALLLSISLKRNLRRKANPKKRSQHFKNLCLSMKILTNLSSSIGAYDKKFRSLLHNLIFFRPPLIASWMNIRNCRRVSRKISRYVIESQGKPGLKEQDPSTCRKWGSPQFARMSTCWGSLPSTEPKCRTRRHWTRTWP